MVLVVKDFGVHGRRADRGANAAGIHDIGMGRGLSIREATVARQRSLLSASVTLVAIARQDEGASTLLAHRATKQRRVDRRARSRGRTLDGERLRKKKNSPFKTCWVKSLPVFG